MSTNGAHAKAWSDNMYRLVVLAYIAAATMPPIGVILALVVLARAGRSYSKHVVWIIVVSIVAAAIWAAILASGALNVTSNDY